MNAGKSFLYCILFLMIICLAIVFKDQFVFQDRPIVESQLIQMFVKLEKALQEQNKITERLLAMERLNRQQILDEKYLQNK